MKRIFIFIVFFITTGIASYSTHIVGGDLSYKCLGDRLYQFTLTVYTECGAVGKLDSKYNIYYFSPSRGVLQSDLRFFQVSQVSSAEESIFCPSLVTNCNLGGTARGIKRVTYTGTINLKTYAFATDWTFYWKKSYRSEEITTLLLPEEEDFFISVKMNNLAAPCNNSPTFQNNPIITACVGEVKTFNHAATDQDGDQLVYSLVSPQSDLDVNVVYESGFSFNNFVTMAAPVSVNATTGDIVFNASTKDQIGVTDVLVKEFRNGQLISSVVRGMQITTLSCSNGAPQLSNFLSVGKDSITIFSGDTANLVVKGTDPEGQKMTIRLLSGKPGIFRVENDNTINAQGRFYWIPNYLDGGKYIFTVEIKDDGCPRPQINTKTYIIRVIPKYLKPDFIAFPNCVGPINFVDKSITQLPSITGNINSWKWIYDDGGTDNFQNPVHSFTTKGYRTVKLIVKTVNGYTDSVTRNVMACGTPVFNFTGTVKCSRNAQFQDNTPEQYDCEIDKRIWDWGDGTKDTVYYENCNPNKASHDYGDLPSNLPKDFNVTLTQVTFAGCVFTSSPKTVTINPGPKVEILENEVIFDCGNPSVVLHSTVTSAGAGDTTYLWSTGATTPNITVSSLGTYKLTVTDKNGCFSTDEVKVVEPMNAEFKFTRFCQPGDSVRFTDLSTARRPLKPIKKWEWFFAANDTSQKRNPVHLFKSNGNFDVKLKITDEDGCSDSVTHKVFNTYFTPTFNIFPNNAPLCLGTQIHFFGPSFASGTDHFDSLRWDFGNGLFSQKKDTFMNYKDAGDYIITLKVWYNGQRLDQATGVVCSENEDLCGVIPNCKGTSCEKIFTQTITINPELAVVFNIDKTCINEPTVLGFRRTRGDLTIPIVKAKWEITDLTLNTKETIEELNPTYTFKNLNNHKIELTVEDLRGCTYYPAPLTRRADVIDVPDLKADTVCAKEFTTFTADFKKIESVTHAFWDFGGNDTITTPFKKIVTQKNKFDKGGIYTIKLTAYNNTTKCEQTISKDVIVKDAPVVDFSVDTVCAGQLVPFTNETTFATGNLTYQWDFGDGNISGDEIPRYAYKTGGTYTVKLTAAAASGCSDYLEKTIYVKDKPKAGFQIEEPLLEAFKVLHFKDASEGDVVSQFWMFGDGTVSTEQDPTHQYDTVKLYTVTHVVTNSLGCNDTIALKTNLNARLELPSAFSPNEDGANDKLSLLYNGIKELYEFKIYNRWGELVFDGGNNLNAAWDGTFRGKLQDIGAYVAYVKALGVYDTKFSFRKNITLMK